MQANNQPDLDRVTDLVLMSGALIWKLFWYLGFFALFAAVLVWISTITLSKNHGLPNLFATRVSNLHFTNTHWEPERAVVTQPSPPLSRCGALS
jgi:hypothetical protein